MSILNKSSHSDEVKSILHESLKNMINEIQEAQAKLMEIYKVNPTYPFDFYSLSLREADTKILCIREIYKRITDEELD